MLWEWVLCRWDCVCLFRPRAKIVRYQLKAEIHLVYVEYNFCELSAISAILLLYLYCVSLFIHVQPLYVGNKDGICYQLLQIYFGANENRNWRGYERVDLWKKHHENTGNDISLTNLLLHLYSSIFCHGISHDSRWSKQGERLHLFL